MTMSEFSRDPLRAANGDYTDIWYSYNNSASSRSTINNLLEVAKHGIDICIIGTTALQQQRLIRKACLSRRLFQRLHSLCMMDDLKDPNLVYTFSTFQLEAHQCDRSHQHLFAKQQLKASNLTTMVMCHLLQEDLKADRPRGLSTCQAQQEDHPDEEDALTLPDHAGYPPGLIPGDTQTTDTFKAFPTDSAERKRNAKREAKLNGEAIVTVKQNIPVEAHFDDCGENLTSLGDDNTPTMYCESEPEDEQYSNTTSSDAEDGLISQRSRNHAAIPQCPNRTCVVDAASARN
jgi:hypothetical protein